MRAAAASPAGALTPTVTTEMDSPLGPLRLYARAGALCGLYFPGHRPAPSPQLAEAPADPDALGAAVEQLDAFFRGERRSFDLDLATEGTEFQRAVWAELVAIPLGETISYGELARRVGRPTAVRAVGAAVGRNPLSIVVPCHRVVGAAGALTGYAGGVERKAWLLRHEGGLAASAVAGRPV